MDYKVRLQQGTLSRWWVMAMLLGLSVLGVAQVRVVSGTVTSAESGEQLIGVSVMVKGTTRGTITDLDGRFSIEATNEDVLVVSMVGMKTVELKVGTNQRLAVSLSEDAQLISELVVTGYSTQKKADLTGAVTVVNVGELRNLNHTNPMQSLQGRVAGMIVSSDGSPSGAGTSVRMRGIGTLNNNDPLYIIDGVPTKEGIHLMNPNDIESIQVLKDASSASIYGSRAANGVIIITTKKAKEGVLDITANARTTFSYYSTKLDVLNAEQYGQAFWQAKVNDGLDPNANSIMYQFDWARDPNGVPVLNRLILPDYLDAAKTMKTADTDWFDEISQTGISQNYDITINNGSKNGHSMVSLDYTYNDGIIKTTSFERLSGRINSGYNLLKGKLKVGENLTFTRSSQVDNNVLDPALQALPIIPVRTVDGKGWGGPVGGMNDRQNPVRLLEDNQQNNGINLRVFGNMYADLELFKKFTFRTNLGIDYIAGNARNMQLSYVSGYLNNPINKVTNYYNNSSNWVWSNTLSYQHTSDKHDVNAMVGTELFHHYDEGFWASRQSFELEDINYMYLDAGTGLKDNGGLASEYALLSYFGKVNYAYASKYLVSMTLRYDGSSRFGKNNQFATFPAFSLGWRLNEEGFIKDNFENISDLKVRLGWGQTGNSEISNNATQTIFSTNYAGGDPTWRSPDGTAYDLFGNKTGNLPSGYQKVQSGNDDLKWETTTQTNIGLDFGFYNQKIFGSIDYYIKDTKDILVQPAYIAVVGEGGNQWLNGASMNNKGFELVAGYREKVNADFDYEVSANFATYSNKITSLPDAVVNTYGGNGLGDNILGKSIGTRYGYVADGLFRTVEDVENSAVQQGKGLGRMRFRDLNGDGTIDTDDQTWIMNPHPQFTYGVNMRMQYKGFDVAVFFQGLGNVDVENVVKYSSDFWSVRENNSNKGVNLLNAWSPTNPTSTIPALTSSDSNAEGRFSTYFIENGAFLKLRNIQLGYQLPDGLTKALSLNKLYFYLSGQNLLTFASKSFTGIDPESPSYGYPIPTMLTAGLSVSF